MFIFGVCERIRKTWKCDNVVELKTNKIEENWSLKFEVKRISVNKFWIKSKLR
jgi:hypothetical protein